MTRLTTLQKTQLTNMNRAAQKAVLGTHIDTLEYGTVATPSAGTIAPLSAVKYSVTPAIGTATKIHAAVTLGSATTTVTTDITNPDFPRILSIKGNASMSGNVVITGTDIAGTAITDSIALNNTSEVMGDVAFKTVTQIVFPIKTNGSGDTVSVGFGNLIGLPIAVPNASTVIAVAFGASGAVDAGSVTVGATPSLSYYTCAGAASFNGVLVLSFILLA